MKLWEGIILNKLLFQVLSEHDTTTPLSRSFSSRRIGQSRCAVFVLIQRPSNGVMIARPVRREREEGERERTVREVDLVTESALTRPRESSLCEPGKKWDCLNSPSTPRVGPPRSQEVWRTIAAINNGKSAPFVPWTANERERERSHGPRGQESNENFAPSSPAGYIMSIHAHVSPI